MGNVQDTMSGMADANNVMQSIPILGNAFKLSDAAAGAGVGILGGVGKLASSPNLLLYAGGAVLLLIILK